MGKRYGKTWSIRNVNLEVYRGEAFGFLGSNGAGKMTTIRTLLDFLRPTSGAATIFGRDSVAIRELPGTLPGSFASRTT